MLQLKNIAILSSNVNLVFLSVITSESDKKTKALETQRKSSDIIYGMILQNQKRQNKKYINIFTFFSFGSFIFAEEYFDRKRDSAISDRDSAEKKQKLAGNSKIQQSNQIWSQSGHTLFFFVFRFLLLSLSVCFVNQWRPLMLLVNARPPFISVDVWYKCLPSNTAVFTIGTKTGIASGNSCPTQTYNY